MKMEVTVEAPCAGTVIDVLCREGRPVSAGQAVVVLRDDPGKSPEGGT
jgi:biotin carboxyl carrier protein